MDLAGEIRIKMKVDFHREIKEIKMDSIGIKNNKELNPFLKKKLVKNEFEVTIKFY